MSSPLMRVGTGRVGTLTPEQETILSQFKTKLQETGYWNEERHDDHMLLRFLRARKFVLEDAYTMIKNYEDWRKEIDLENLVRTFQIPHANEVAKLYPRFYHNIDKQSRPVYIEQLGKVNLPALTNLLGEDGASAADKQQQTLDIMLKHFAVGYENLLNGRFPACSKVAGKHVDQCFTILDIKDVGLGQISTVLPFIKATSKIAQDYYPEMMGKVSTSSFFIFIYLFNFIFNRCSLSTLLSYSVVLGV